MSEPLERFDYELFLDQQTRAVVRKRTDEIKGLIRRTAQDIIEVGVRLVEVKDLLPHGFFGTWLKTEFDWSERTAQRFMSVAYAFKSVTVSDLDIQPKALYLLAAKSTPEEARLEAIEQAETGETISYSKANKIVAAHKSSDEPFIRAAPSASGEPRVTNRWIDSVYRQITQVRERQDKRLIAEALTASQLQQISEMIDFLQDIEALGQVAIGR